MPAASLGLAGIAPSTFGPSARPTTKVCDPVCVPT
jgi:hypothetical protein